MPAKAKTQVTSKAKVQVKPKPKSLAAPKPKAKAQIVPKAADTDEKESNRLRQQRFLEKHREEINAKRRERYTARKEAGQCPRCGKKLRSGKNTLCKDCLQKARDYNSQQ